MRDDQISHERDPTHGLTFDIELYRSQVAELNLTPEQQDEYLHTLWAIIVQFVDLGFPSNSMPPARRNMSTSEAKSAFAKGDISGPHMVPSVTTNFNASYTEGKSHDE